MRDKLAPVTNQLGLRPQCHEFDPWYTVRSAVVIEQLIDSLLLVSSVDLSVICLQSSIISRVVP